MVSVASILIAIVAGYIVAVIMSLTLHTTGTTIVDGQVVEYTKSWVINWDSVAQAKWIEIPKIMPVKMVFSAKAIIPTSAPFHAVPSWLFPSASVFALLSYSIFFTSELGRYFFSILFISHDPYKFVPIRREQKGNKYGSSLLHIVRFCTESTGRHSIAVNSSGSPASIVCVGLGPCTSSLKLRTELFSIIFRNTSETVRRSPGHNNPVLLRPRFDCIIISGCILAFCFFRICSNSAFGIR